MYSLWIRNMNVANSEELCIYNDETAMEEYKLADASLTLEEGSAGSLSLKIPKTNIGYGQLYEMITQIIVRKDGDVYWIGRLLSYSTDFYGTIDATFEGAYNFLMDTIITPLYDQTSIVNWVTDILTQHNQMVLARGEYFKTIVIGHIDTSLNPSPSPDLYADYETSLDVINNVIEGWKAHPRFSYQEVTFTSGNVELCTCWCLRLDLYSDYDSDGTLPEIAFGQNLMDYATEGDVSDIATCIIPRGATYSDEDRAIIEEHDAEHPDDRYEPAVPEDLDMYRTIYSVTSPKTIYLYAPTAQLNQFGIITKVVDFSDCEDCTELLSLGQKYLQDQKWLKVTINISAIDAKLLGIGTEEIKIGRKVHCISPPHNLDFNYPCVGIREDILDAANTSYTLGVQDESYLTSSSRKIDDKLKETVVKAKEREKRLQQNVLSTVYNSPTEMFEGIEESIEEGMNWAADHGADNAKVNALKLLNIYDSEDNPTRKGYVHFVKETAAYATGDTADHITEICISDDLDYTASTSGVWRWNRTGLYFLENGYSSATCDTDHGEYQNQNNTVRVAITKEGEIVADRITVGVLNAGVVKAGYLTSWDEQSILHPDHPELYANFVLDISNGIMKAKKGTLIFNGNRPGTSTTARVPQDNFLYLSNEVIGTNANIGGFTSNKWMFILGSSFGVDNAGRCYMREGVIGATGGIFDLEAINDGFVKCTWVNKDGSTTVSRMVYTFYLGTTASRPVLQQSVLNDPTYKFYFRMAHYDSNDNYVFLTGINGPVVFDPGNASIKYESQQFNPDITYNGNTEAAEANNPAFYEGEVFPVFYALNDQATEDYYEEGGHRYVIPSSAYVEVKSRDSQLRKQYESHSDHRYGAGSTNVDGAVMVGSGYIYQGNIGTNASFSLSGLNRSATLSVPSGTNSNTITRDDWRFTVGSKFGVTDDGTLYCNGAYLRNMIADAKVVATSVDTASVGGVQLKATHPTSGDFYSYSLTFRSNWIYAGYTAYLDVFLSSASHTDTSGTELPIDPDGNGHISQANFYSNIAFNIKVSSFYAGRNGEPPQTVNKCDKTFTYLKSVETSYTGAALDVQTFDLGSTSGWTDVPRDITSTHYFHHFTVMVTMDNEHTSSAPIWQMAAWNNPETGSETSFTGIMNVTNSLSNNSRLCMSTGRDVVGGTKYWLGGPQTHWGHAYINTVHTSTSGSGSSKLYKNHIAGLADIYEGIFDKLRPVSYYLNEDERHVRHLGFILEEIGEILKEENIDPDIFGAYSPDEEREGGELYYNDFIALNTWQIQKLKKRLDEIEERLYEVGL